MTARIRDARPGDAEAIARVHEASRSAAYGGRVDPHLLEEMDREERRRRWAVWLVDPSVTTLVAEEGGEVVGFATLRPTHDRDLDPELVAEMPTLYVHPERWRRGLGSLLFRAVLRRARALGFRVLSLWVLDLNREARAFYETLGLREDGSTKLDDGPTPAPILARRYRLRLGEGGRDDADAFPSPGGFRP